MACIVPAILTDNPAELVRMVRLANSFADFVQIDIMDGVFVPPMSIHADDLWKPDMRFRWEAHLMVSRPSLHVESFVSAGAERITIHAEADEDVCEAISLARGMHVEVGLALNPETAVSQVEPLLPMVDIVLLLTVEPGYYGSLFLPGVLPKVVEVRAAHPGMRVAVDGGIKEGNLLEVARTGVDEICVGSAIFRATDPAAAFRRLQDLAVGRG
ncbi:MAG: ribulose-phosphate 3-epimerase [Chloroflexota bacterium]